MVSDPESAFDARQLKLVDGWQRDFPLAPRPFRVLADAVQMDEADVIGFFKAQLQSGTISRIGPVINQAIFGASALVAMQVPAGRLHEVAAAVNSRPEVNHNYEREHALNLWFVVLCRTASDLDRVLARIRADTGCRPIALPMESGYHIDLGFSLENPQRKAVVSSRQPARTLADLSVREDELLQAVQHGIAVVATPWQALGERVGMSQAQVLATLRQWLQAGVLKRFGVVVRHRRLGYRANAMCVWDVDDAVVDAAGMRLAREPAVTLCYKRSRHRPEWPYNLFCMIHGKERVQVESQRAEIAHRLGLDEHLHAILFSRQSFKQQGAWLGPRQARHECASA